MNVNRPFFEVQIEALHEALGDLVECFGPIAELHGLTIVRDCAALLPKVEAELEACRKRRVLALVVDAEEEPPEHERELPAEEP